MSFFLIQNCMEKMKGFFDVDKIQSIMNNIQNNIQIQ